MIHVNKKNINTKLRDPLIKKIKITGINYFIT